MSSRGVSDDEIRRRTKARTDQAEQRKIDAVKALKAQQSLREAEQAKTVRLRALRLARDAELAAATAPEKQDAVKAPRKKKAAPKA